MSSLQYTAISDIPNTIKELRYQFDSGLTKDIQFRKDQLQSLARFIDENLVGLQDALRQDLRKHEVESSAGEIIPIRNECEYMLKHLDRLVKPDYPAKHFKMFATDTTYVRKEPKGVVLVIGAWNYPVRLLLLPVVGAIAAGNCVVLKPSEVAEHTANFITTRLPDYLDKRAYTIINGAVQETTALLEQKFDHIFYTGNGAVGRIVMTAAAKQLTPVTLELGGKSPGFICSSADIELTAHRLLWGKYYNCGQTCIAPDYVLIPENKVEMLIDAFRKTVAEFFGEDPQASDSYGRIISASKFDRLKSMLNSVDSTKIVIGGQMDRADLYIAPTVVSPVDANDQVLMSEEIFGPILPVITVKDMDEAIRIVNSKEKPLTQYIFTNDDLELQHILNNTMSGGVLVNDTLMHLQETSLPFGGVGESGMGAYHGEKSFATFTHERSTMIRSAAMESLMKARYPPYDEKKLQILHMLVIGLPAGVTGKIKSVASVCSSMWEVLFSGNRQSKL
ncbi:hypothetical protein O0I10_007324 [Lichtheimia ornata]|uniref:Aldehyde dehydrogenase n=1 Tax=Lichtheimia ornata TaxID=688661 RepID=A0AAD7XWE7_9FUNG|nr:uncharacterized protein O0I10_007324 [Lichtheimia ornata]KAJ8656990.1 hypothetical protein O0I10_007324 [Lichtheimia ornata]